ncbi:MAG: alpha/beta fold hydrolase [Acidimicrobiia bacterium]
MAELPGQAAVLGRLRRDLDRLALRTRAGLKHLAGVGRPQVGVSPRDLVWQRDKARLYRYRSDQRRIRQPILLVMSLVTKPYVFDLSPGNSFVESLLARGFDVYAVDWGVPDVVESENTLETYCDEYLPRACAAVLDESDADAVTVYGYCLGGVLSLLFAAANPDLPVGSLVLMTTPVDLSRLGPAMAILRDGRLDPDELIDETGNVPMELVFDMFRVMKITGDISAYAELVRHLDNSAFVAGHQAIFQWAHDHIPFPGATFRQIVRQFLRDEQLLRGRVELAGRPVDLRDIACPVLNLTGAADQIIPPESNAPLLALVEGIDNLQLAAGHAGLIVGRSAQRQTIPAIAEWIEAHSEAS